MHAYWFSQHEMRHIQESVSGKGLGANQTTNIYYAQTTLSAGDRLLFFGRAPSAWDSTLNDPIPSSLDAMRRRLTTLTSADLNAVLMQATNGAGVLNLLSGIPESKENKKEETAMPLPLTLRPGFDTVSREAERTVNPTAQGDASGLPRQEETISTLDADPFDTVRGKPVPVPSAHMLQPSAYAIPPQHEDEQPQNNQ